MSVRFGVSNRSRRIKAHTTRWVGVDTRWTRRNSDAIHDRVQILSRGPGISTSTFCNNFNPTKKKKTKQNHSQSQKNLKVAVIQTYIINIRNQLTLVSYYLRT